MRRREFITLLGGAAAGWPLAASAQQAVGFRRIGVLMSGRPHDPEIVARLSALQRGLRALGWVAGSNTEFIVHYGSGDADAMRAVAKQLVEARPDVIVGTSTPGVNFLHQETRTVPIVFLLVSDPIGSGFVQTFARPGGNITGFSYYEPGMSAKCIELLRDMTPQIGELIVLFNPDTAINFEYFLRPLDEAARAFGVKAVKNQVRDEREIEQALRSASHDKNDALFLIPDPFTIAKRKLIISLALQNRLPAVYPFKPFAIDGGLMSFGVDAVDQHRVAASYVDRILKGEKPADLPVQAPTKFELVINLKTARALGLNVPPMLLARADEVIE